MVQILALPIVSFHPIFFFSCNLWLGFKGSVVAMLVFEGDSSSDYSKQRNTEAKEPAGGLRVTIGLQQSAFRAERIAESTVCTGEAWDGNAQQHAQGQGQSICTCVNYAAPVASSANMVHSMVQVQYMASICFWLHIMSKMPG